MPNLTKPIVFSVSILFLGPTARAHDVVDIAVEKMNNCAAVVPQYKVTIPELETCYWLTKNGPDLFDCSGLSQYCYKHIVDLRKGSWEQEEDTRGKDVIGDYQRGDLLFFDTRERPPKGNYTGTPTKVTHVGIYQEKDQDGNEWMIEARDESRGIIRTNISTSYWTGPKGRLIAARRLITPPSSCPGNALQFDGVNNEVDIPHNASLSFGSANQMTVELWFRLTQDRSVYHLLGKRVSCGNTNYQLAYGSGELHFSTGPSPAFRVGTLYTPPVGQWVHVAATCDGSNVRLYVNGQLKATGTGSLGNSNSEPLRIGQSGTCDNTNRFVGQIDEVRIWNVARSEPEIAANYNRTIDPSTSSLVGYWNFDETSTSQSVLDHSSSHNDGTLGASLTPAVDDPARIPSTAPTCGLEPPITCPGNALQFDGVIDKVLIPDNPSLAFAAGSPMTVECWIYPTPGVSSHAILARRSGDRMNYQLSYGGTVFDFFSPGSTRVRRENYDPPLNQWTHVAGTYDGTTSHLYINGIEQGTSTGYTTVNNPAPLEVGGSYTDPRFVGQIDEVRIWNVARSQTEIAAYFMRTVAPNTPGLVGYWNFDENPPDQAVIDRSGQGNNGTLGANSSIGQDDPVRIASTAPFSGGSNCAATPHPVCIDPAAHYGAGANPHSVVAVDLNGDHFRDLAVSNVISNNVSVLMNQKDGTFEAAANYTVGNIPVSVCAVLLDNNSSYDLATANNGSNDVSVLLNKGDGTFNVTGPYAVGTHPSSIVAADLDGDAHPDLAVANEYSHDVWILKNNGDGTFSPVLPPLVVGGAPYCIGAADLDNDHKIDLVVADRLNGNVVILRNRGAWQFDPPASYSTGGDDPRSVTCVDLDRDGDLDLAVANYGSNSVSVLKNNGNGVFSLVLPTYPVGSGPLSVVAAELNGDCDTDLAVTDEISDDVWILTNSGCGSFDRNGPYAVGRGPKAICAGDLNGDGIADLAVAIQQNGQSTNVGVLINCVAGGAAAASPRAVTYPQTGSAPKATLGVNYPNPFNAGTVISFNLPVAGQVNLTISDILGRTVTTLVNDRMAAGPHQVQWDGRDSRGGRLASGIYFYRLQTGNLQITRKMLLLK